jgi:hypothetical protein
MAIANSLIAKFKRIMTKYNVSDRLVYKRVLTRSGGDPLLGRGGSVMAVDTILNPQPVVGAGVRGPLVGSGNTLYTTGEYVCTVLSTAMTRAEVTSKETALVFKDSLGVEEVLYISSFQPSVIEGVDVAFELVLTSKKR